MPANWKIEEDAMKVFTGEDIKLISIGTGEMIRPLSYDKARGWGKVSWMVPALECMFDGVSDAANYQMKLLLGKNYIRLQTSLSDASDDMDTPPNENIVLLEQEAKKLIQTHRKVIDNLFSWIKVWHQNKKRVII